MKPALQPVLHRPAVSLAALAHSLAQHRQLVLQLVRRDLAARYRGSVMGLLWSLLLPMGMLAVYSLVFGTLLAVPHPASRLAGAAGFVNSLFIGLLLHGLMAEILSRSPGAVLAQPNYVKKVVFPVELLPGIVLGSAVLQFLLGSAVLLLAVGVLAGVPLTLLAWPLTWLGLLPWLLGLALALSALTVYLRDLAQLTGFVSTLMLFLAPVFYPLGQAPAAWQTVLLANPLTIPIEAGRAVLLHGVWPNWPLLALHALAGLLVLQLGWWVFQRCRTGFADVL